MAGQFGGTIHYGEDVYDFKEQPQKTDPGQFLSGDVKVKEEPPEEDTSYTSFVFDTSNIKQEEVSTVEEEPCLERPKFIPVKVEDDFAMENIKEEADAFDQQINCSEGELCIQQPVFVPFRRGNDIGEENWMKIESVAPSSSNSVQRSSSYGHNKDHYLRLDLAEVDSRRHTSARFSEFLFEEKKEIFPNEIRWVNSSEWRGDLKRGMQISGELKPEEREEEKMVPSTSQKQSLLNKTKGRKQKHKRVTPNKLRAGETEEEHDRRMEYMRNQQRLLRDYEREDIEQRLGIKDLPQWIYPEETGEIYIVL